MIFFYLLLAHLISDYLLQPGTLVAWKNRSRYGVAVHASIHFLVTALILYLYTGTAYSLFLALGIASVHFIIDCIKATYDQKTQHSQLAYWSDQTAHYLTLAVACLMSRQWPETFQMRAADWQNYFDALFFNPVLITFSCLAIFVTLTVEFSFWRERKNKKAALLNRQHMLKRLFLATLVYIGLLFALVPSVGFNF